MLLNGIDLFGDVLDVVHYFSSLAYVYEERDQYDRESTNELDWKLMAIRCDYADSLF